MRSDNPTPALPFNEGEGVDPDPGSAHIHVLAGMRASCPHFTPCISLWISGAIRNSSTPKPSRIQKPMV